MVMLYFVNRATQSSSHNWPMEVREPDWRLSKMCRTLAWVDSSYAERTRARLVVLMLSPLATWMVGPWSVCFTLVQNFSAAGSR